MYKHVIHVRAPSTSGPFQNAHKPETQQTGPGSSAVVHALLHIHVQTHCQQDEILKLQMQRPEAANSRQQG